MRFSYLREQGLYEELRSKSLHESFLNFHVLVKQEQGLHQNRQARTCSNENKSGMRVDES